MKNSARFLAILGGAVIVFLIWGGGNSGRLAAKDRNAQVDPNDPTYRLYSLLDSKYNGKLEDFCVLAALVPDPKNPGQSLQRVLRIDYNKDRGFGKLDIYVRTVAPLTPAQLKAYTPKQTYDFAETDTAKFIKTDVGPFGKPGDVYLEATPDGGALGAASITPDVQTRYEHDLTEYILPALEKKGTQGSTS